LVDEPESEALASFLAAGPGLTTSALALVEVPRAIKVASADPEVLEEAGLLLSSLLLMSISDPVLRRAAELASLTLRTLDAIHLATAERAGAALMLTYDRRLGVAARQLGLQVVAPT
jgi:uncharacterized protein